MTGMCFTVDLCRTIHVQTIPEPTNRYPIFWCNSALDPHFIQIDQILKLTQIKRIHIFNGFSLILCDSYEIDFSLIKRFPIDLTSSYVILINILI